VIITGVLREEGEQRVALVTEVSMEAERWDGVGAYRRAKIKRKVQKLPATSVVIGRENTSR
jgi:hypothetical protein